MKTNRIKLNESQLHKVIKESVKQVLSELKWQTYADAERKWADTLFKNPNHPKRKSSIMGHEDSTGTHDIYTDDRLRNFQQARVDAFNREFGYNTHELNREDGSYSMDFPYQDSGMSGYYDRMRTQTTTPSKGAHHRLEDTFHMDSIDGTDKYPSKNHEVRVSHVNGRYAPNSKVNRDAVEPQYDNISYMQARNRGNQSIIDYQNKRK